VSVKETTITLPTYAPGGYDKTPIFYTGRVYQGAQGRVYPYPMQDVLHDQKVDETYTYLTLENEWLHMGLLPEHGGHLLNFTDKQTGFETFYRQHVVKPALIGMLGAWISGGVEWNFPHHHRATTAMPIDWRIVANDDGSKTIWFGETELRRRLKWTIGLSLLPDRAVLQAENVFMNRQPWIESMLYWANVSVHCGDDYQVLFPPSCRLGCDHHKSFWTSFPIGPMSVDHSWLPSQRSKYADEADGIIDLSWWKNFTAESRSIFAMDPENSWLAGYDHKKNAGTAHVSNRHITVGKKFFLWGNFPEAYVWDKVLTDHDGPYLELMVGCWSDNQPDYSWIAPYETRKIKQFWFPVKGIGGVKNVTIDGAVNVERLADDKAKMLVGFHSTRALKGCTVTLYKGKEPVFTEKNVALDPNTPWCKDLAVDPTAADQAYTAALADVDGKVFLSYTPVGPDPNDPLPPKVENPLPPQEYTSAELAYQVALRLDQFHNGLIDPEPYYKRALEIDPDYTRANAAMGVRLAKNGSYAAAKPYLERAVARATQNYTRALDAAPEYYLALVERALGNMKRAEDLFWRCTWRSTYKKEAFYEIARLAALRGAYQEAHEALDFGALPLGMDEAKFHTFHAYLHRKLKDSPDATAQQKANWRELAASNQKKAFACDPLEYWGLCEEKFADGKGAAAALAAAEKNRGLKAQQLLECVSDYWGIGAWDEVIALCDAANAAAAREKPYATEGALPLKDTIAACDSYKNALFGVFKGAALEKKGDLDAAKKAYAAANAQSVDYCFPNRLEEEEVLLMAVKAFPGGANLWYYLGCDEWNHDRKDAALADWRKAVDLDPKHALALRCLGFGLAHPGIYFTNTGTPVGVPSREAYAYYKRALAADPDSFRILEETDKLAEKLGVSAAERLATMQTYRATAEKYDACILRMVYLFNEAGNYDESLKILTSRRFHVWEGGEGLLAPFVDALLLRGLQKMAAKDFVSAQKDFETALTYPENLQAGRPGDAGTDPKVRYCLAQCRKAQGDEAGYRAELEKVLKGWVSPGEMNYYRFLALTELGRTNETAAQLEELKKGIAALEKPIPQVIDAYAKFGGSNTPAERMGYRTAQALYLRGLIARAEGKTAEARTFFGQVLKERPAMIWAKAMLERP
jgi:Tfp pilus assembly protein PilF